MKIIKLVVLILIGSFLVTSHTVVWAVIKTPPIATNSPYNKGFINNSCSGCTSGLTCCSSSCVDLQNDANNCGACGAICASPSSCLLGSCSIVVGGGEED